MKHEVLRPEGIDLFYFRDDLDITIQQHVQVLDAIGVILLPIIAFLSIFIYFFKDISVYVPIAFTLGSIYFIYKVLNSSNNKTHIDINDKFLSIRSRPKNLKKDRSYASGDIDQLYLKHSGESQGYYVVYMIINGVEGQKHEKLLTVNSLSKAKYLEQEMELYLNIENRVVPDSTV